MPAQVLGLEGQNCPHSAGGSKGDIILLPTQRPGKSLAENKLEEGVNLPEDQEQDLAEMLGAVVIAAWEKSWATLNYPEGELFLYFFHRQQKI